MIGFGGNTVLDLVKTSIFPRPISPPWRRVRGQAYFLATLMVLFSTNSLLIESESQTETEFPSNEIRMESISSNSPGQVLGHIDTHDTLSIGRQFACAVTENSSVVCWGEGQIMVKPELGSRALKSTTT